MGGGKVVVKGAALARKRDKHQHINLFSLFTRYFHTAQGTPSTTFWALAKPQPSLDSSFHTEPFYLSFIQTSESTESIESTEGTEDTEGTESTEITESTESTEITTNTGSTENTNSTESTESTESAESTKNTFGYFWLFLGTF